MKFIYSLLLSILFLGGCSSSTLLEAIEKTGHENVEILVQDESENLVIFLNQDYTGQSMVTLNNFSEENGSYHYEAGTGEFSKTVDLKGKSAFVKISQLDNSSNSIIWGGIFNYPNADTVSYSLLDEKGNTLYQSSVRMNEENIAFQKLPPHIYQKSEGFSYQVLDNKGDVIIE